MEAINRDSECSLVENYDTLYVEANGNKLDYLVYNKGVEKELAFKDVHHDIANIFIYQATIGVLSKLDNGSKRLYLDKYSVKKKALEELYTKYSSLGLGIMFHFITLNRKQYFMYTDNEDVSDTDAEEFIYIIGTPLDHDKNLLGEHFAIFNLKNNFDINTIIDDHAFRDIYCNYKKSDLFRIVSDYRIPDKPSDGVFYPWEDINKIMSETNSQGNLYDEIEFIIGEVPNYKYILDFFRRNPKYGLDENRYREAYAKEEKRITILGRYVPEEFGIRRNFFDMGSLYP